jgi:hypothetical protein
VGSVMRERILSSVDFPAPLRPMMPTTSPAFDLERDVAQCPELLFLKPGAPTETAPEFARGVVQRVPQVVVTRFMLDHVALRPD